MEPNFFIIPEPPKKFPTWFMKIRNLFFFKSPQNLWSEENQINKKCIEKANKQ